MSASLDGKKPPLFPYRVWKARTMHDQNSGIANPSFEDGIQRISAILRKIPTGASVADEVLSAIINPESPFTMAVVGPMRSGKSTLINSLVGKNLSQVDVTETTATVNWIRHGGPSESENFRVTWDTTPVTSELVPWSERDKWSGNSEYAKKTRYLEYFCEADFLKRVQIVDTPGSRSVIESHQETLENFITAARRCEDQSNYYGGTADCIAYVFPVASRDSDDRMLSEFSANTRLPGSSPFNSIGILPKWEATIDSDMPWAIATRQAERIRNRFRNHVSDVIVVSGPLHSLVSNAPDSFWESIITFVFDIDDKTAQRLLLSHNHFCTLDINHEVWNASERSLLLEQALMFENQVIPWRCFVVVMKYARHMGLNSAQELKQKISELSGISRLLSILEERFFERAQTIRTATRLSKAMASCKLAARETRIKIQEIQDRKSERVQALAEISNFSKSFPLASDRIRSTIEGIEKKLMHFEKSIDELENAMRDLREPFDRLNDDLKSIHLLDENLNKFQEWEVSEILGLLGAHGTTIHERCKAFTQEPANRKLVGERLANWLEKHERSAGVRHRVIEQVVIRLEEIACNLK